jgi:tyrosyl-tRNA synthetase
MEAKKKLARTIVAGFHGEAAAQSADENWARMFQQKDTAEDLEEVRVEFTEIDAHSAGLIRLPKLLVLLGLAGSTTEANRKIAEKAVKVDGVTRTDVMIPLSEVPTRAVVRLGKRAKIAVIGLFAGHI